MTQPHGRDCFSNYVPDWAPEAFSRRFLFYPSGPRLAQPDSGQECTPR
jgi:hypothetical protein